MPLQLEDGVDTVKWLALRRSPLSDLPTGTKAGCIPCNTSLAVLEFDRLQFKDDETLAHILELTRWNAYAR